MNTNPHAPQSSCRRCGICCRKGGPALHLDDRDLVREGKIPLKDLFTIRQGEPSYDNIAETLAPAGSDIVKIKPAPSDGTTCIYYRNGKEGCTIYTQRPWECRTLACWNPRPLINQYQFHRLTRRHLLSEVQGLWELVCDHQKQCNYQEIARLAAGLHKARNDTKVKTRLMELVRYDHFLRESVVEHSNLAPELLEFLLGRPLKITLRMFQLKLIQTESETTIRPFV
jgi:Fe-S-cluster containining protein